MRQGELARGIVSQSLISHMEHGRIIPSNETLIAIADRLGCNRQELLAEWRDWKRVHQIREQLWAAVCRSDEMMVCQLLQQGRDVLPPDEYWIYTAWEKAYNRDVDAAERCLEQAWFSEKTLAAKRRLLVVDAWIRRKVYEETGRLEAARHWQIVSQQRWAGCSRGTPPATCSMI